MEFGLLVASLLGLLLLGSTSADSCLDCICKIESECKASGCEMDGGSLSCGYFQIKRAYYIDCGTPGRQSGESIEDAWKRCANDYDCAKTCVEAYFKRYTKRCPMSGCEAMARVHNDGPRGCFRDSTLKYWNKVKNCCNCY